MKTRQTNSFEMYRALQMFLAQSGPSISTAPALAAVVADFDAAFRNLEALAQMQAEPISPALARRDQLLAELAHATIVVAGAVFSYATERRNGGLAATVRLRPSDFVRTRLARRVNLARPIHEAAVALGDELAAYGITPAMLADLHALIAQADEACAAPRGVVAAKSAATARIRDGLRELGALVRDRLEPLVFPLRRSSPQLYEQYRAVRQTIHRRGTRQTGAGAEDAASVLAA